MCEKGMEEPSTFSVLAKQKHQVENEHGLVLGWKRDGHASSQRDWRDIVGQRPLNITWDLNMKNL